MTSPANPFRLVRALAFAALAAVVAARPAGAAKVGGRSCRPDLRVVPVGTPTPSLQHHTDHSLTPGPEPIAYGRASVAPALDKLVARLSHVHQGERILGPHLSVVVSDAGSLTPVRYDQFSPGVWDEIVAIMSGTARGLLARNPSVSNYLRHTYSHCTFATIRARLNPGEAPLPLASLTLGPYHYNLDLRSHVRPARSSNRNQTMEVGTYRARRSSREFAPGPEFERPIPGGLTNRGFFKGRVVGQVDGSGQLEPIIKRPDPSDHLVSGTWHFKDDWLILRLICR